MSVGNSEKYGLLKVFVLSFLGIAIFLPIFIFVFKFDAVACFGLCCTAFSTIYGCSMLYLSSSNQTTSITKAFNQSTIPRDLAREVGQVARESFSPLLSEEGKADDSKGKKIDNTPIPVPKNREKE